MANKLNLEGFTVSTSDVCTADGGFVGDITGAVDGSVANTGATTYTVDGAIDSAVGHARLNAAISATQMTISAAAEGTMLAISATSVANTCDVDANFGGAIATITFTAAGQGVMLVFNTNEWHVVGNNGASLS
jgi:hypothetical protein